MKIDYELFFKKALIFLFVIFFTIYITQATGYYEYQLHKKVELTNEQIDKFESDVKEGKPIDLNDYLKDTKVNYSNNVSKMGNNFSNITSKYIKKCIEETFKFIESLLS